MPDSRGWIRDKKLGAGAQGSVYRCSHAEKEGHFAVKDIVCATPQKAAECLQKQQRTQRMLAQVDRHVVRYHDTYMEQAAGGAHRVSIVMDYSEEGDLTGLLRSTQHALEEERVVSVAAQLAEALKLMHGMQPPVLHMDVKPGNVLSFGGGSSWKLTDFDASQDCTWVAGKRCAAAVSVGASARSRMTHQSASDSGSLPPAAAAAETTMAYTAPEVASGSKYGPRCDVFSLGVVMFCMAALPDFPLLDETMFNDPRWADRNALRRGVHSALRRRAYIRRQHGGVTLIGYSHELADIITLCLTHDPDHRPSASSLFRMLYKLYEGLLMGTVSGPQTTL